MWRLLLCGQADTAAATGCIERLRQPPHQHRSPAGPFSRALSGPAHLPRPPAPFPSSFLTISPSPSPPSAHLPPQHHCPPSGSPSLSASRLLPPASIQAAVPMRARQVIVSSSSREGTEAIAERAAEAVTAKASPSSPPSLPLFSCLPLPCPCAPHHFPASFEFLPPPSASLNARGLATQGFPASLRPAGRDVMDFGNSEDDRQVGTNRHRRGGAGILALGACRSPTRNRRVCRWAS